MRRLPSLRGLQAFEAVARTGNLTRAAETLGITVSAVSHRIRGLEDELGVPLLKRQSRGLALTEAGARYRAPVEEAFRRLAQATADLLGPDLSRPLTISLYSEFGLRWLMPRLHRFRAAYPDMDFSILSGPQLADLVAGEADLAVRYGRGQWPGLEVEPLLMFSVTPLCAPSLRGGLGAQPTAEALARQTLLRVYHDDWDIWLEAAGVPPFRPAREFFFGNYSMATQAAINGEGLLLGYSEYAAPELSAGTLVQPFEPMVVTGMGYHLVYLKERLADPRVRAFRDWVVGEVEGT